MKRRRAKTQEEYDTYLAAHRHFLENTTSADQSNPVLGDKQLHRFENGKRSKIFRLQFWARCFPSSVHIMELCPLCRKHPVNALTSPFLLLGHSSRFLCPTCFSAVEPSTVQTTPCKQSVKGRMVLWMSYFGTARFVVCPCCSLFEMDALSSNWHQGHRVAAANGGTADLGNLLPICCDCNYSMGTTSVQEFQVHQLMDPDNLSPALFFEPHLANLVFECNW